MLCGYLLALLDVCLVVLLTIVVYVGVGCSGRCCVCTSSFHWVCTLEKCRSLLYLTCLWAVFLPLLNAVCRSLLCLQALICRCLFRMMEWWRCVDAVHTHVRTHARTHTHIHTSPLTLPFQQYLQVFDVIFSGTHSLGWTLLLEVCSTVQ